MKANKELAITIVQLGFPVGLDMGQVTRWLREKHGLHLYCQQIVNGGWVWTIASTSDLSGWSDNEEYPDHDTALIAGIEKAIEIVKERNTLTGPAANTEQ